MRWVLVLAAVSEAATGVALLLVPSMVGQLLFASPLNGIDAVMARLAGIALIGLGVACWPDRNTRRAVFGMLIYGLLAMLYLTFIGVGGMAGILLWPAVAAHAGLSALLVLAWRKERQAPETHMKEVPARRS